MHRSRGPQTAKLVPKDFCRPAPAVSAASPRGGHRRQLRTRGLNTELYHQADKLAKQIRHASPKASPFVWFPPFEDGEPHEVKGMASG